MTSKQQFIQLLENALDITVLECSLKIKNITHQIYKTVYIDGEVIEVDDKKGIICHIVYEGKLKKTKANKIIASAAAVLAHGLNKNKTTDYESKANILSNIVNGDPIDTILNELSKLIVSSSEFENVGIFLLNEILLELRGLVFASKDGRLEDNKHFRSRKIRLTQKSALSDVLYFGKSKHINLDELKDWQGMKDCLNGKACACRIMGMDKKVVGVIIATNKKYTQKSFTLLQFYTNICSLAISSSHMRSELLRLKTYEEDFDRVDYVSKDLVKMGMLAATVAHELKNPLIAIGGFAKRLAGFCSDLRMDNYITMIQSEVTRLENLVTEILDYSKNVDLKMEEVSLSSMVNETLRLLSENLSLGMIQVRKGISQDLVVYADKSRFIQVLINVIINAIQVMPSGGDLKIYAEESAETIILYVKDNGGGIPTDEMEKIFEPFHSSKHDGTGLGLSLSKKIMTAHGGQITVTNDNTGAVFSLILPKTGGANG